MATLIKRQQTDITSDYGGMYVNDNAVATAIDTSNIYHPMYGILSSLILNGWTFTSGASVNISSVAGGGSGEITVTTSTNHNYSSGDAITHVGTTNYNGQFIVKSIGSATTYNVTETFAGSEVGRSIIGDRMICPSDGIYFTAWSASSASAGVGVTFNFAPVIEAGICSCRTQRKFANNDVGAMAGVGIITYTAGDQLSFGMSNTTNVTDMLIVNLSLQVHRI